ncbi:MAG: Uma2 family endonuclease [Chthoniobacterales bacterium]
MTAEHAEYYTSPEDYLAGERVSQQRHEYLAGVIYAMAGTTIDHSRLVSSIGRHLGNQLAGGPCDVFTNDIKVQIQTDAAKFYYYPEVIVDCGSPSGGSLFAKEPRAIFEVLSVDTERIDRGEKLRNYQSLPTLELYALVDQHHVAVTLYRRSASGWTSEFLTEKSQTVALASAGFDLPLAAIYERTHLSR